MRNLAPPPVDDEDVLLKLARSRSAKAVAVTARSAALLARYQHYRNSHGDPWAVAQDPTFGPLKESLKSLYGSKLSALEFLKELRDDYVKGACPVCGRESLGTLDHYLPKGHYAEFSFFSLNLVPACHRCNSQRNDLTRGGIPAERLVHPYFDDFLSNRVLTIDVDAGDGWRLPRFTPIAFGLDGDEERTVQWHIDNIIVPAGIHKYIEDLWGTLINKPRVYLGHIPEPEVVRIELDRLRRMEEIKTQSLNAWASSLYHGLLRTPDGIEYLANLVLTVQHA